MRPKAERLWDKEPKSILRSIKPFWLYLILTGRKTVELSKTVPKSEFWNKVVYLYCSKDLKSFERIPECDRGWMSRYLGKVACRFVCSELVTVIYHPTIIPGPAEIDEDILSKSCVPENEAMEYSGGRLVYGWVITELVRYEEPREVSKFSKKHWERVFPMKRPPESWCYVRAT